MFPCRKHIERVLIISKPCQFDLNMFQQERLTHMASPRKLDLSEKKYFQSPLVFPFIFSSDKSNFPIFSRTDAEGQNHESAWRPPLTPWDQPPGPQVRFFPVGTQVPIRQQSQFSQLNAQGQNFRPPRKFFRPKKKLNFIDFLPIMA